MKSGSLVVYIGGQTDADISAGYGLDKDTIYEVNQIGFAMLGVPAKKIRALSLMERPGEAHAVILFREVQPPDEVNISEIMHEIETEKVQKPIKKEIHKIKTD